MKFQRNPDFIERDRAIIALMDQKYTRTEIALHLGLTKGVVEGVCGRESSHRKGRGKPVRIDDAARKSARKAMLKGMDLNQVARLLDVTPERLDRSLWKYLGKDTL